MNAAKFAVTGGIALAGLTIGAAASAQIIDPACDVNSDGVVDGFNPSTYPGETRQYHRMLTFFAFALDSSPLHAPLAYTPQRLNTSVGVKYVPQLSCLERTVFDGTKTEHTNKTSVLPQIQVGYGLPLGFYVGATGLPPVKMFGVQTLVLGAEAGYGRRLGEKVEVGGRAHVTHARVNGDLAGPSSGLPQDAVDDSYRASIFGVEGSVGYGFDLDTVRLVPYLGAGFTGILAYMTIGEDRYEVDQSGGYYGANFEAGAHARVERWDMAAEVFMAPNMRDTSARFFASPRLRVGYEFGP
jgi:hypothetical protein